MSKNTHTDVYENTRCPGPSMQDILRKSKGPVPDPLSTESYVFLGYDDIPYYRYNSSEYFSKEMECLWPCVWQWACREEHIPEIGDYYVYDIGDYSILIVRTKKGIKGYFNSCLHRGTKLKPSGSEGASNELRCPYHGWTWSLDGDLKYLPCKWDLPHVSSEKYQLPEVKIEIWGGFVFVNMDQNAETLESYLGILIEHFENWDLSMRFVEVHIQKELPCNWKLAQEAFMESYHTMETHPQLLSALGDINTQYDIFSDNISRYYSASGVSSPHLEKPLTEHEMINSMFVGNRNSINSSMKLEEGENARDAMARILRDFFSNKYRVELSKYTDTEIIDTIGYGLFPNTTFFPGISIPMVYRFRPLGMDPERSIFDLIILRPAPDEGQPPSPPEPRYIAVDESYASAPELDPHLAKIFDQDTNNMKSQQEGIKTSKKSGATLTNYQEIRIRHMHKTLEKYCGY